MNTQPVGLLVRTGHCLLVTSDAECLGVTSLAVQRSLESGIRVSLQPIGGVERIGGFHLLLLALLPVANVTVQNLVDIRMATSATGIGGNLNLSCRLGSRFGAAAR